MNTNNRTVLLDDCHNLGQSGGIISNEIMAVDNLDEIMKPAIISFQIMAEIVMITFGGSPPLMG